MVVKRSKSDSFRAKQQADSAVEFTQIPKNQDQEIGPVVIKSESVAEVKGLLEGHEPIVSDAELDSIIERIASKQIAVEDFFDDVDGSKFLENLLQRIATGLKSSRTGLFEKALQLIDKAPLSPYTRHEVDAIFGNGTFPTSAKVDTSKIDLESLATSLGAEKSETEAMLAFMLLTEEAYSIGVVRDAVKGKKTEHLATGIRVPVKEAELAMQVPALASKEKYTHVVETLVPKISRLINEKATSAGLVEVLKKIQKLNFKGLNIQLLQEQFGNEVNKNKYKEVLKESLAKKDLLGFKIDLESYEPYFGKLTSEEFLKMVPQDWEDVSGPQKRYVAIFKKIFGLSKESARLDKTPEQTVVALPQKIEQPLSTNPFKKAFRRLLVGAGLVGLLGVGGYKTYENSQTENGAKIAAPELVKTEKAPPEAQKRELKRPVEESINPADTALGVHEIDFHDHTDPDKRKDKNRFEIKAPGGKEGYYREFAGTELLRDQETGRAHWVNKESYAPSTVAHHEPEDFSVKQTRALDGTIRIPVRESERIVAVVTDDNSAVDVYEENRTGNFVVSGSAKKVEIFTAQVPDAEYKHAEPIAAEKTQLLDFKNLSSEWQQLLAEVQSNKKLTTEEKAAVLSAVWGENYVYNDSNSLDQQVIGQNVEAIATAIVNIHEGICNTSAAGLAALLREVGIPARIEAGNKFDSNSNGGPHMWTEFWSGAEWVPVESLTGSFNMPHKTLVEGESNEGETEPGVQARAEATQKLLEKNKNIISKYRRTIKHEQLPGQTEPDAVIDKKGNSKEGTEKIELTDPDFYDELLDQDPQGAHAAEIKALTTKGLYGYVQLRLTKFYENRMEKNPKDFDHEIEVIMRYDIAPLLDGSVSDCANSLQYYQSDRESIVREAKKNKTEPNTRHYDLIISILQKRVNSQMDFGLRLKGQQDDVLDAVKKWDKTITPQKAKQIADILEGLAL